MKFVGLNENKVTLIDYYRLRRFRCHMAQAPCSGNPEDTYNDARATAMRGLQ